MNVNIFGNIIVINIGAGETDTNLTLPDGYSIEHASVSLSNGALSNPRWSSVLSTNVVNDNNELSFPVVNGKSPNTFRVGLVDTTKSGMIKIMIDKFGLRPDSNYFADTFEPLNITDNDGNEYNVIPTMRG